MDRVTITLPRALVEAIDKADPNRSGFLARAAKRELKRQERLAFKKALDERAWTADDQQLTEAGFQAWADTLPKDDVRAMVDLEAGIPVRWVPGVGWLEGEDAAAKP